MDSLAEPLLEIGLCFKAEKRFGTSYVKHTARLPIWLCLVPAYLPGKTCLSGDEMSQVFNAHFIASPYIYRFAAVILFHCQDNPFGSILNIEKFSGRLTRSPHFN